MRFTHTDVNFEVTYDGDQKPSNCSYKVFLNTFDDLHIWCQNLHQYVWTSLCEFIFFVNLLHSPCVWPLTSFWHTDVKLLPFPILGMQIKMLKDVKLSKDVPCKKNTYTWTMEEVHKKINWHEVHTYWCWFWCHIWKNPQNVHRKYFWPILMTFILDFDILHLFSKNL